MDIKLDIDKEMDSKMQIMGMHRLSTKMYMLKHLNRRNRVILDIPFWTGFEWGSNKKLVITEVKKGQVIDPKYLIKIGCKPEDIVNKSFTIAYQVIDRATNQGISSGFCETRNDIWEKYLDLINDAYNFYSVMNGKPKNNLIQEVIL